MEGELHGLLDSKYLHLGAFFAITEHFNHITILPCNILRPAYCYRYLRWVLHMIADILLASYGFSRTDNQAAKIS